MRLRVMSGRGVHTVPSVHPSENGILVATVSGSASQRTRFAWTPFRGAVAALLVVVLALRLWSASHWTWVDDDWIYMEQARAMPVGTYLFQNYNGHFMPGEFAISWVLTQVAPLNRGVAVWLTAVTSVLSVGTWALAFRELFGERLRLLLPLALLAASPLVLRPTIWWASAMQMLPLQFFTGLCVFLAARYVRRLDRATAIGLLSGLVVSLLFWEKCVLILVPVVCVLLFCSGVGPWASVRRASSMLFALATATVIYVGIYRMLMAVHAGEREMGVTLSNWQSFGDARHLYTRAASDFLVPAMLGGPWGSLPIETNKDAQPGTMTVVISTALLVALTLMALVFRRRAWLPVLMVGGYAFLATTLVLFSNRVSILGDLAIRDERYLVDTVTVAALGAAMLITPLRGQTSAQAFRHQLPAWATGTPARALVGMVVAGSLSIANVLGIAKIGTHPAKPWVANITKDVRRLAPLSIWNSYAPDWVLSSVFWAQNARLARMLSPLHERLEFNGPAETLYVAGNDGHLRRASIGDVTRSQPGPVAGCGYAISPGQQQRITMTGELYAWEWGLQVNTFAGEGGTLALEIDGQVIEMKIDKGMTKTQGVIVGPVSDVRVSATKSSGTICLTDVFMGPISAEPRR